MCSATEVSISPVAIGVSNSCDRSAWPTASHASRGSSIQIRSCCSSSRHIRRARARSHCWLASTMNGPSPRCSRIAATRSRSRRQSGWPTLILMPAMPASRDAVAFSFISSTRGLEEAAGGVVDAARVAVRAEQLGQREVGAAGLEVPQRHVERGHGLGRDAGAADGGARPHQRLVDLGDVARVLPDRDLGDLLEVGELRLAARALGVGEPHAGEALLGGDLDEEQHRLGERLLLAGEHLGIAHRVGDAAGRRGTASGCGWSRTSGFLRGGPTCMMS